MRDEVYNYMINICTEKYPERPLTSREHNWKKDFVVMKTENSEWLVRRSIYDNHVEEFGSKNRHTCPRICHWSILFQSIYETHVRLSHAAAYITHRELIKQYSNISMHMVTMMIKLCPICAVDRYAPQRKAVIKPILSSTFNDRGQVDLIDMQSQPDGPFNWILHYQDHLTKFSYLRALKKKSKLYDESANSKICYLYFAKYLLLFQTLLIHYCFAN